MEQYKVKPVTLSELNQIDFRELYISPDLSIVSGITDYKTSLFSGENVMVSSTLTNEYGEKVIDKQICNVTVENVKRQGKIHVTLSLPVKTITKKVMLPIFEEDGKRFIYVNQEMVDVDGDDYVFTSVTQNYVEHNGNISYFFNGDNKGYLIDGRFYTATKDDNEIIIDELLYIEDGKLFVGDREYTVLFNPNHTIAPTIQYGKYGKPITNDTVLGEINGCVCKVAENDEFVYDYEEENWERIQKVVIENEKAPTFVVENVLLGGYKHFVEVDGQRYWMVYSPENDKYGFFIDSIFYPAYIGEEQELFADFSNFGGTDAFIYLNDDIVKFVTKTIDGESVDIEYRDKTLQINSVPTVVSSDGKYLFLMTKSESLPLDEGSVISVESMGALERKISVEYDNDENDSSFILFNNERYDIQDNLFDCILLNGVEFKITYTDDEHKEGFVVLSNGEEFGITIENSKATPKNKVYYLDVDDKGLKQIKYGVVENAYDVIEHQGVIVNGIVYKVEKDEIKRVSPDGSEEIVVEDAYVLLYDEPTYELIVTGIDGSSTYLCIPLMDKDTMDENESSSLITFICSDIASNPDKFNYRIKKNTFGKKGLSPTNSLVKSMSCKIPITVSDRGEITKTLRVEKISNHVSFNLPLSSKVAHNLMAEDIINNLFTDYMKSTFINDIVDMEKDVYSPVYLSEDYDGDECDPKFKDIHEIRFNMHFRTRNLENWKPYDNTTSSLDEAQSVDNWFITDYKAYQQTGTCEESKENASEGNFSVESGSRHNASDLIGLLNFTTSEIRNHAKKISNSFLRMSLYSTDDINTQVLLGTVTMYLDGQRLLKNYMELQSMSALKYADVVAYEENFTETCNNCGCDTTGEEYWKNSYPSAQSEVMGNRLLNDKLRLSSRITVKDKYNTSTSSEGFYQYIYKEYTNKKHINTIYARFEFNHAGIGQSIPMMLPRKIENGEEKLLYIDIENDAKILKAGFPMKDIYKQLHVPIKVKYDGANNRYVYWLGENLRSNKKLGVSEDILEFNLFEVKFKDQTFIDEDN